MTSTESWSEEKRKIKNPSPVGKGLQTLIIDLNTPPPQQLLMKLPTLGSEDQ